MRDERHAASALTPRSIANLAFRRDALQAAMHCIDLPPQRRTTGAMQQRMLRLVRAYVEVPQLTQAAGRDKAGGLAQAYEAGSSTAHP
ncbi:hypothetical protein FHT15_002531 [Xanthomonas campestris]